MWSTGQAQGVGGAGHVRLSVVSSPGTKRDKKKLKDQEDFKTIFMYDDLTPLRAKLLRAAKNHPNVRSAYTRDGIIHCNIQNRHT